MIAILYLLILLIVSFCLGRRILDLFKYNPELYSEMAIVSLGIGLGSISLFAFFIGIFGLIYKFTFISLFFIILIFNWKYIKELLPFLSLRIPVDREIHFKQTNLADKALLLVLAINIVFNLIGSLAPSSSMDALTYHLAVPKLYAENHRIFYIPSLFYANFPMNLEMLYLIGILFSQDVLANLVHLTYGLLSLWLVIFWAKQYFSKTKALLAGALFYTTPFVFFLSTSAYIDLGLVFYLLLTLYFAVKWLENQQFKYLALSGIFCGLSAGTKMLGLESIIIIWIILILFGFFGKIKNTLSYSLIFVLSALIFALPWYIKTFIYTGNPVFPFFFSLLNGRNFNMNSYNLLFASHSGIYGAGKGIIDFFLTPYYLILKGDLFDLGYLLNPVCLFLFPFAAFFVFNNYLLFIFYIFAVLFYVFWFFTSQQARFLLPIMPGLSLICSYILTELSEKSKYIKTAVIAVCCLYFVTATAENIYFNSQFIPVVFGSENKDTFLTRKTPFYADFKYINQNIPKNSKILFCSRAGYYLEREYIHSATSYQGLINYSDFASVEEFVSRLKVLGITHVFKPEKVQKNELGSADKYLYPELKWFYELENSKYLKVVYHNKSKVKQHRTYGDYSIVNVYLYEIIYP